MKTKILCFLPFLFRLIIKTEFLPTKYRGYMLPLSQVRYNRNFIQSSDSVKYDVHGFPSGQLIVLWLVLLPIPWYQPKSIGDAWHQRSNSKVLEPGCLSPNSSIQDTVTSSLVTRKHGKGWFHWMTGMHVLPLWRTHLPPPFQGY